jgi:hypothetical protein
MSLQTTRLATLALVLFLGASTSSAQSITTVVANNGGGGVFLDLTPAAGALNLTGFRTYMRSNTVGTPGNIEVWTRPGSYVGNTGSNAGWTLTQTLTASSNGRTTLTALIPLTSPIFLPAGTTTAVYLQGVTVGNNIQFNGGTTVSVPPPATTTYSNADITVFTDFVYVSPTAATFAGTPSTPRCFAGVLQYTPAVSQGACCSPTAACTVATAANCAATSTGSYSGDNTSCNPNLCTHRGACCSTLTNTCTLSPNGAAGCAANSTYQGDASTCNPNICPQGACCNAATGGCNLTAPTGCLNGNSYQSDGTTCSPSNPCPQPPPPANDDCINAQSLALNVAVQSTNALATGDGFEGPAGACYTDPTGFKNAVWFTFSATATTNYLVSTCGSTFDTALSIFSVSDPMSPCDSLVAIACDDDTCIGGTDSPLPGPGSSIFASVVASVHLTSGQTYYIRLASAFLNSGPFGIVVQYSAGITVGSCCVSGVCTFTDSASCTGTYTAGAVCTPNPCPQPGACCSTSDCTFVLQSDCTGGTWRAGVSCSPNPCLIHGVCCRGSTCSTAFASAADCAAAMDTVAPATVQSKFVNATVACNSPVTTPGSLGNTIVPCCYANYNHNNSLEVQDIFDFLNDWFAGKRAALVGGDGTTGALAVQNIFDFLNAWFAGGCN